MNGADPGDTVSVIIPTWNSARYLAAAITSTLEQTHPVHEVLVVDDGSSDESAAIAESFGVPVRVIRQPHGGQGRARNHGARLATGEWLAFLDADDLWLPGKLALQLAATLHAPGTDIVFGRVEQFFSPELGRTGQPGPLGQAEQSGLLPSALCCRRDAFWRYGGFAEDVTMGEMLAWYSRARDDGAAFGSVDDVVVRRRIHDANTGITHRDQRQQFNTVIKQMLDRRRAAALGGGGDE